MAGAWALDAWNSRLGPSREGKGAGGLLLWPVSIFGNAKPMVYLHVIIYSCYSYFMESYAPMYRMVDWCCWMLIVDVFFRWSSNPWPPRRLWFIDHPAAPQGMRVKASVTFFLLEAQDIVGKIGKSWEYPPCLSMLIHVNPCVIVFFGVKIPANTIYRYL